MGASEDIEFSVSAAKVEKKVKEFASVSAPQPGGGSGAPPGFGEVRPIRALLTAPQLARLEVLNLECCNLDDDTVRTLAASPHLTRLRALNLLDNPITENAVEALLASPVLRGLTTVVLGSNTEHTISEDGDQRAAGRFDNPLRFETVFGD
jgi:hypothetical protein